jgi:tripartite-type tricarboxylate transporter receptor subunit TctC
MNHHALSTRRQALKAAAALAAATGLPGLPGLATAQGTTAPGDRTVKFILPNATGSGVDTITRSAQQALAKALGHPVIVENQPGAGGVIGVQAMARSAPDGFTLSVVSNNVVIFPSVIKQLPFTLPDDVTPIAIVGNTPIVLVANPQKVPAKDHKEFAAQLKASAGKMSYASGGIGTILHLASEMYLDEIGAKALHVPYKGVGPMLTDLIGGQVEFATAALPSVQQHLASGALKAIGVGGAQRSPAAPNIPTFVEQGLPGYQVEAWFAVLGPKAMPAAEVRRVHAAVVAAFADPAVKDAMAKQGNVINVTSPEQAQSFFRSELQKYARLVKKAGIEAQ